MTRPDDRALIPEGFHVVEERPKFLGTCVNMEPVPSPNRPCSCRRRGPYHSQTST